MIEKEQAPDSGHRPAHLFAPIFGDQSGYVCAFTGRRRDPDDQKLTNTKQRFYSWPDQAGDFEAFLQEESDAGREAYFCAHKLTERDRKKHTAAPVRALWVEADQAQPSGDFPAPSFVVESSPGRYHYYWMLDRDIDPGQAEQLNRRLTRAIGGDHGWMLGKLLRAPGTTNYKYPDTPQVRLTHAYSHQYDPADLAQRVPQLPEAPTPDDTAADGSKPPAEVDADRVISQMLKARNADKVRQYMYQAPNPSSLSEDDFRLASMIVFYTGWNVDLAEQVMRRSSRVRDKWDEPRNDTTWIRERVQKAISRTDEFYTWPQQPDVTPVDPARTPGLGQRSPIGEAMRHGVEPPVQLIDGMIYAGMIHSIYGMPGTGKTNIALWASLQTIRQGQPVLYLDQENGFRTQAERLVSMGATPDEVDRYFFHYASPAITLEPGHLEDLRAEFDRIQPGLVVFDSWADFLALGGLDENTSTDVTGWVLKVCQPLKEAGAAVLILDHVTKEGGGYGGRGSGAKMAKLDAAFKLTNELPYDRGRVGSVMLTRDKDREACLFRRVRFAVGGDGNGRLICRPNTEVQENPETDGLTASQQAALDAIRDKADPQGDGITRAEWLRAAGQAESTFDRARDGLLDVYVEKVGNKYRPVDQADQLWD